MEVEETCQYAAFETCAQIIKFKYVSARNANVTTRERFNCGIVRLGKKRGNGGVVCARNLFPFLVRALPRKIIIASEDWSTELRSLALNIFLRAATVSSLLGAL